MTLYRLVDEESRRQPVSRLCQTLGVTRSGFYDYRRQPLSDRALADWLLTEQIRVIFAEIRQEDLKPNPSPERVGRFAPGPASSVRPRARTIADAPRARR